MPLPDAQAVLFRVGYMDLRGQRARDQISDQLDLGDWVEVVSLDTGTNRGYFRGFHSCIFGGLALNLLNKRGEGSYSVIPAANVVHIERLVGPRPRLWKTDAHAEWCDEPPGCKGECLDVDD